MRKEKFSKLFQFLPKSKIKAGDGKESGEYPLYTSSPVLSKYYHDYLYEGQSLIFGTGGQASIHYAEDKFSTSTDCFVAQPLNIKEIYPKYVYFYLKSHMKILEDGFKGAGLKHISKKYISNIKIPLPKSLEEQIKIANLLTKVEALISKREESIALLEEMLKSTFLDMFIFNEDKHLWRKCFLAELVKKDKRSMRTGPFGSNLLHSEFNEKAGVAVLGIDNAVKNRFEWGKKRYITTEKYQELKNYTICPEDVIITIMGTVGRSAVVPKDIPLAINTKHLAAITLDQSIANPYFISYSIHSNPEILSQIKNKTRGAIMAGFNLSLIKKLKFSLPPKPLQDKFATIVQQVEATKAHYQKSLDELHQLFGSLSQRAFNGELDLSGISINEKQEDYKKIQHIHTIDNNITISSQPKRVNTYEGIMKIVSSKAEIDKKMLQEMPFDEMKEKIFAGLDKGELIQKFENEHIEIDKK